MNLLFRFIFSHKGLNIAQVWNLRLISLSILFTTFSGAIRKWGALSGLISNLFLVMQIVLPLVLFLGFRKSTFRKNSGYTLVIYFLFLFISSLNPLNQTIFHGALGLFLHLGFWLLIFTYLDNPNSFPIERLIPFFLFLLAFQTAIGFLQYQLPPSHFLNRYSNEGTKSIAMVGKAVRVTGTFSYLSGYTAFLMGGGLFLWAIFKSGYSVKVKYFTIVALLVGSLLSGSRAALIISLFFVLIAAYIDLRRVQITKGLVNVVLLGVVLFVFLTQSIFVQRALGNILLRFEGGFERNEYQSRTIGTLAEVWNFRGKYAIVGVGLGSTYQGANAIWGESKYVKAYRGYEEEPERILIEGGYILLIFKILLWIILLNNIKAPWCFILPLVIIQFIGFPIVFNVYNAFFLFFGLALIDRVYRYPIELNSFKRI